MVEHEVAQRICRLSGHQHHVVVGPGNMEGRSHPRQARDLVAKLLEVTALVPAEADGDHRLDRPTDSVRIDVGVNAADHSAFAQRPHTHQTGGFGDAGFSGQGGVGGSAVGFKQADQRAVRLIERLSHRCGRVFGHTEQPIYPVRARGRGFCPMAKNLRWASSGCSFVRIDGEATLVADSDNPNPLATRRKRPLGLFIAVPLLAFSGLYTSWGGAVRWKDCWQVAPWRCSTHDDMYALARNADVSVDVYVGSPGAAAPLAIGSLLAFFAVVALVVSTKPRLRAAFVVVLASPLLVLARSDWRASLDPQDMTKVWDAGPLTPVVTPIYFVFILGGLFIVAAVVASLGQHGEKPLNPAQRTAWWCVAILGLGHSVWGLFVIPQMWSGIQEDRTWMWTLTGILTVGAALLLTWSLGRDSGKTPGNSPTPGETSSAITTRLGDHPISLPE